MRVDFSLSASTRCSDKNVNSSSRGISKKRQAKCVSRVTHPDTGHSLAPTPILAFSAASSAQQATAKSQLEMRKASLNLLVAFFRFARREFLLNMAWQLGSLWHSEASKCDESQTQSLPEEVVENS